MRRSSHILATLMLTSGLYFAAPQQIEAATINVSVQLKPNLDGVRSTAFPCLAANRSDCAPPTTATLTCNDSAAPSLSGQTVSTSYSENVRQYFSGTAAATAALALVTVSGSNAATTGWAISGDNLTISSATVGTGALMVTGTTSGNTVNCSARNWSRNAASSDGGVAPTIPTGLSYTAGTNSVTISGDAPSDPPPSASRIKQVNLRFNGTGATTAVTVAAGLSRSLTQSIIGSSDGTPASSQTGTAISLGFGGTGWDSIADNFLFFEDTTGITGDAYASATYVSLASSATFPKDTIMARESDAVGAKFVTCSLQKNGKLQMRYRATDNVASVLALNQAITITSSTAYHLVRTGDSWTCEASDNGGATWDIAGGSVTVVLAGTLHWGAAITSTSAGVNATGSLTNWSLNNIARWSYVKSTGSTVTVDATAQDNDNNVSAYTSAAITAIPTALPALRFKPGHYSRPGLGDTQSAILGYISTECGNTAITGYAIYLYWKKFETSKGVYDFSFIDPIIAAAANCGKYIIFRIQNREFGSTNAANAVPQYLVDEGLTYSRTSPSAAAGAALWMPAAADYNIAAYKNFIDHEKGIPANYASIVMLTGEESIYGQGMPVAPAANAYSAAADLAQQIRIAGALRAYAPELGETLFTNWWNGEDANKDQMRSWFTNAAADKGIFLSGGPDAYAWAGAGTPDGYAVWNGTAGGIDYRDSYPSFGSTEALDFQNGATISQVFTKYDTTFRTNYMIWARQGGGTVTWSQILTFLGTHPVTHTSCPSGVTQGCQ